MATNATGIESGTAVDSMDSLVVVKTARKMRHAHHVTCTCMVSAGESGLVQPIDKSSNDSAKSFVTRSTGNRKSEVGVSRPRPQVLSGGGHSLTHHPRSPIRRTALLPPATRCQPFPGCLACPDRPRLLLLLRLSAISLGRRLICHWPFSSS
jgi:hypothetical protein